MAIVAYKRVSTVDQKTDRQLAETKIKFDKVFEDKISGKNTDRPQLQAMIEYVREGDEIYIHSLDRLARNNTDLQNLVNGLTSKGVTLHFVKEKLDFSKDKKQSSVSLLMFQMLSIFAEFERNLIRERQKEGIAKAKEKGKYKGRQPIDNSLYEATRKLIAEGLKTTEAIARTGIKPATYYRYLKAEKENK